MAYSSFVVPRKTTEYFTKGKKYPVSAFISNQLAVSVMDNTMYSRMVYLRDTDFLIVLNSKASDEIKIK